MAQEPLNATFFAFHRREEGGGVLLGATVLYGGLALALAGLAIVFAPQLDISPETITANLGWLMPTMLVAVFVCCVAAAAYEAACLRWMIRGEAPGLFGLTLNEDTWRIYGVYWVWLGLYLIGCLAHLILWGLLSRLVGDIGAWIGAALLGLALLVTVVTFAPGAALTVHQGRFALLDAAEVTENRFAELLRTYAVVLVLQWMVTTGAPLVLLVMRDPDALGNALAEVSGVWTLFDAYTQLSIAAWEALPPILQTIMWPLTTAVSLFTGVLIFGVNARVVLAALGPPPRR